MKVDTNSIIDTINFIGYLARDLKTDSYEAFDHKKSLYKILWCLEENLKKCPKFSIEDEWLNSEEKLKIINYLKNNKN